MLAFTRLGRKRRHTVEVCRGFRPSHGDAMVCGYSPRSTAVSRITGPLDCASHACAFIPTSQYVFSVQAVSRASCPCGDGSPVVISDSCATGRIHSHQLSAKTVRCVAADSLYTGKMPVIRLSRVYTAKHIHQPCWSRLGSTASDEKAEASIFAKASTGQVASALQSATSLMTHEFPRRLSQRPGGRSLSSTELPLRVRAARRRQCRRLRTPAGRHRRESGWDRPRSLRRF